MKTTTSFRDFINESSKDFISNIKLEYDQDITPNGYYLSFEIFGNDFVEWLNVDDLHEVEKVDSQFDTNTKNEIFGIVQSKMNLSKDDIEEMYFKTLQKFVDKNKRKIK